MFVLHFDVICVSELMQWQHYSMLWSLAAIYMSTLPEWESHIIRPDLIAYVVSWIFLRPISEGEKE